MQLALFTGRHVGSLIRSRQAELDGRRIEHGGLIRRGRRKLERPVSTRRPMHVVLSSRRATGAWSLRKHERNVQAALRVCAHRANVRVYDFANVGSHVHLLLRARRREDFQAFLRAFAGIVAQRVTGARRGRPVRGGRFWSALAWSRIVAWGRDYWGVRRYVFHNQIEATSGAGIRRAFEQGPDARPHRYRGTRKRATSVRAPPTNVDAPVHSSGSSRT